MKVTFLDIPDWIRGETVEKVFGCNYTIYPFPNIFSLGLAALLRQKGIGVGYEDFGVRYQSQDEFVGWLQQDQSDVYCIHSVNLSREGDLYARGLIRQVRGDVAVVFTGPGPTIAPRSYLHDDHTVVMRGEADAEIERVVWRAATGSGEALRDVPGVTFRMNGEVIHTKSVAPLDDVNSLPFPARDLLCPDDYANPKLPRGPWTTLLTSRGCSFKCTYCVPHSHSFARELEFKRDHDGRKPLVRMRSIVDVYAEIQELRATGYRSFSIIDDQFIWGEKRTLEFCEMMKPLKMEWGCLARSELITENIARAFGESGCRYVDIGAESFSQEILDFVHKGSTPEDTRRAVSFLKRYGVGPKLNILVGAGPLETKETLRQTLREVLRLKPDAVMFSALSPFPGTEFYDQAKKEGWLAGNEYKPVYVQQNAQIKYPNLSQEELQRWLRYATLRFYLSPSFILRNICKLVSWRAAIEGFKVWWRKVNFSRGRKVGAGLRPELNLAVVKAEN